MAKSKRLTKYIYAYVVQGNYGYGWDDLTMTDDYAEARADYRAYRDNENAPHRIIQRRVLREDW